jgi:hypothetical protein
MNNPPSGPFDKLMVLSLSKDFDFGLFRPPLRACPELVEGLTLSGCEAPSRNRSAELTAEARNNDLHVVAGAY